MLNRLKAFLPLIAIFALASCNASGDNPGTEYAPQMYHSIPYEPLTQIKEKDRGEWLSNREDGLGEFYNSNPNNAYEQNVKLPVAGTVRRTADGVLPYRLGKDDIEAASLVENPLPETPEILAEGKRLYELYCDHCHGTTGQADGLVSPVFQGVPPYTAPALRNLSEGHIFHVITYGIRRMGAHGSQISPEKRWKIVKYVKQLQQK
ncbi:c-type cytochrome [Roseivirga seohaensis]|nr:cytochrome c [Roseivirga seohaensis]